MIALSCFLFTFVCLAQSKRYYGQYNHGNQGGGFCYRKPNGNYQDPDYCYGFITCLNWKTYKKSCFRGWKYNKDTNRCVWPQYVQCGQEAECKTKTTTGKCCSLPFFYGRVKYNSCTKTGHNKLWCSLDTYYKGSWGECEVECKTTTTVGKCCSFPFTYKGVTFNSCTKLYHNKPWCSLDTYYKGRWGNCGTSCKEGSTSYDECGQRCTCVGGQLNCVRIRKEFTSLTDAERKRHIDTILKVSAPGGIYRAEYEQLINEHYELFNTLIHQKQHFIPWHRYFILRYENLMRKADCTFTATYWDWSLNSREPFSTASDNIWNSDTGFGGDGSDAHQNCVLDGPFRMGAWSQVRPDDAPRGPDCLMRNFNGNPPEEIDLLRVLNVDDFTDFELTLREILHDNVHCQIGATMCTGEAASAPEFFLHHAFIDKIWDDWQKKSSAHKYAYFPTVHGNMPGTNLRPAQLIDLSNQPGGVSVEYEPFKPEEEIRKKVKGLSPDQLRHYPRRRFTGLSLQAITLFKISLAEVKKIRKLEKWIDPNVIQP